MLTDIEALKKDIDQFTIDSEEALEAFRLEFLSRKGKIQAMFGNISSVPKEERAQVGKAMNAAKNRAQQRYEEAEMRLKQESAATLKAEDDITLPAAPLPSGSFHPLTQTLEEMKQIFYRLGFNIADGPEIEDDFHNFSALNFPPNHPARDEQDTFFIRKDDPGEQDLVLRTHTSPVQIRLMQETEPPIRAIMPGRVYRNEAVTPKSYFLFHQVEALFVDTDVSVADLKATLINFAKLMFGSDVKYRLRPGFFPFTEPSLEMDIWWETQNSPGKWLEILGSGMVDPNVFEAVDIDPEKYTGFALGMGVERIAMLRHGIDDIRVFYRNDNRFLKQFH
jgi:phenylalanyl-tRNA synthetase alpha chain